MRPDRCFWGLSLITLLLTVATVGATEPNEIFSQATTLGAGVLSVNDSLTPGVVAFPDTMLGIRDQFGSVYFVNDDGSPVGDGSASGVGGVPTNSGSISFVVSGYPDEFFEGNHSESGGYQVFIDVYDFFDELVSQFSEVGTLQPGIVDAYGFSDFEWIGGSYDVYIDNTIGGISGADVDFFTFTGLTPGSMFSVETKQTVSTGLDTVLGWFDASGTELGSDDDSGTGLLSLLTGTVPANGLLTFAVTGTGDLNYGGSHTEDGNYTLQLSFPNSTPGDFDNDGDVDGRDFLLWQRTTSVGSLADWQLHYGTGVLTAITAVPEPCSMMLIAVGAMCVNLRRGERVGSGR